ncbi:diacylglycerol/lipid kinase family protein [Pseudooceanicola sp. 502str34]
MSLDQSLDTSHDSQPSSQPVPESVTDPAPASRAEGPFAVIANAKSGTNARDQQAIDRVMAVLEDAAGTGEARLYRWSPDQDMGALVDSVIADGARTVIAAGGDGTAMAVAGQMVGREAAFAVLPLGTFNYFTRGLGLPEEPDEAARVLLDARPHAIRVGQVNGRVFLNNASLGIYPAVLKERETVYKRWGRRRIMAHWSVARTFWQFQHPMHLTIEADGETFTRRTPLLFVSRSAYQLERFGLEGDSAISDDKFAVLIGRGESRADLFRIAFRLVTRTAQRGRDYDFLAAGKLLVHTKRDRTLVAFDGEKSRDPSPFDFCMCDAPLTILLPETAEGDT